MSNLEFYMSADAKAMTTDEIETALSALSLCRQIMSEMPAGATLWDAALCKFHRHDPAGIEFMQSHEVAA